MLGGSKAFENLKREIQIMEHLSGQPDIVEYKGAYEDYGYGHLVMELCTGGDLFDRITAKGHYCEKEAAAVLRSVVNIVHTCHLMGVMRRDLKPQNLLLSSQDENAVLKVADFGLSVFIDPERYIRIKWEVISVGLQKYYRLDMVRKPMYGVPESYCTYCSGVDLHFRKIRNRA